MGLKEIFLKEKRIFLRKEDKKILKETSLVMGGFFIWSFLNQIIPKGLSGMIYLYIGLSLLIFGLNLKLKKKKIISIIALIGFILLGIYFFLSWLSL